MRPQKPFDSTTEIQVAIARVVGDADTSIEWHRLAQNVACWGNQLACHISKAAIWGIHNAKQLCTTNCWGCLWGGTKHSLRAARRRQSANHDASCLYNSPTAKSGQGATLPTRPATARAGHWARAILLRQRCCPVVLGAAVGQPA